MIRADGRLLAVADRSGRTGVAVVAVSHCTRGAIGGCAADCGPTRTGRHGRSHDGHDDDDDDGANDQPAVAVAASADAAGARSAAAAAFDDGIFGMDTTFVLTERTATRTHCEESERGRKRNRNKAINYKIFQSERFHKRVPWSETFSDPLELPPN